MLMGEDLFPWEEGAQRGEDHDTILTCATNPSFVPSRFREAADSVSHEALGLLRAMLEPTTEQRVTAQEALAHPFIVRSYAAGDPAGIATAPPSGAEDRPEAGPVGASPVATRGLRSLLTGTLVGLRAFAQCPRLRRVSMLVVAHLLNANEVDAISWQFRFLARNGWRVEESRLRGALADAGAEVPEDFAQLFDCANVAVSGALHYVEFTAAAITAAPEAYCRGPVLRAAYRFFDSDGLGFIDSRCLHSLLPERKEEDCASMIREACGQDWMTFEDFARMMVPGGEKRAVAAYVDAPALAHDWSCNLECRRAKTWPLQVPSTPASAAASAASAAPAAGRGAAAAEADSPRSAWSLDEGFAAAPMAGGRKEPRTSGGADEAADNQWAVASTPSEAFAIRQAPGFHRSTLRPFYGAQPVSNVVLGLIRGSSGYVRRAVATGVTELVACGEGGSFFFMPNPKFHERPEDVFNPEWKVRIVAWWIHPGLNSELEAWAGNSSALNGSQGAAVGRADADVDADSGVGAPGDFGYSDVGKPAGYLHTCRDLAGAAHVSMLDALVGGARRYLGRLLGDALPAAHVSAGFHYPVRPQYSTLHLQCRVNSGDVCPGEGRGVDLFRLLRRLREDPEEVQRDAEALFYEATKNLRTALLGAALQAGTSVSEVGPKSLVLG